VEIIDDADLLRLYQPTSTVRKREINCTRGGRISFDLNLGVGTV
jgi:hypothetical protein